MAELKSLDDAIKSGVEKALNKPIMNGKSVLEWAKIGMDYDRVNVVRCSDCVEWEAPTKAEQADGETFGRCRCRFGNCYGQLTDMNWFCADGEREGLDAAD